MPQQHRVMKADMFQRNKLRDGARPFSRWSRVEVGAETDRILERDLNFANSAALLCALCG